MDSPASEFWYSEKSRTWSVVCSQEPTCSEFNGSLRYGVLQRLIRALIPPRFPNRGSGVRPHPRRHRPRSACPSPTAWSAQAEAVPTSLGCVGSVVLGPAATTLVALGRSASLGTQTPSSAGIVPVSASLSGVGFFGTTRHLLNVIHSLRSICRVFIGGEWTRRKFGPPEDQPLCK
jgi:hypothetical protein